MKEKYYLTTAIPYTSRKPHIGNTYELILTDCVARYKRMCGYDVFMLTGTDEGIVPAQSKTGVKLVSLNLLLENDTDPVVLPEQACVVSEILEAIYTSAKTGEPVYFNR